MHLNRYLSYLSCLFKPPGTVRCRFTFASVDLGINIFVNYLDMPHVVAVFLHGTTDRTREMVRTRDDTNVPADVCRDEVFACLAPPTTIFMPSKISPNWSSAPFAERQTNLAWSDDDWLKKLVHYLT